MAQVAIQHEHEYELDAKDSCQSSEYDVWLAYCLGCGEKTTVTRQCTCQLSELRESLRNEMRA